MPSKRIACVALFLLVVIATTIAATPAMAASSNGRITPQQVWSWMPPSEQQRLLVLDAELRPGWEKLKHLPRGTRVNAAAEVGPSWVLRWNEAAALIQHAARRGLSMPVGSVS